MGQEEPVEMCGTLSEAGPTESLRKADFLGNTYVTRVQPPSSS